MESDRTLDINTNLLFWDTTPMPYDNIKYPIFNDYKHILFLNLLVYAFNNLFLIISFIPTTLFTS